MSKNLYWVMRKDGMFYGANHQGYSANISDAGLYSREEAQAVEKAVESVKALPYLIALHGEENLRYDWATKSFWHVKTLHEWHRDSCSIGGYMVQHALRPTTAITNPVTQPVVFQNHKVTADAVRLYRDQYECGMMEAKLGVHRAGFESAMETFKNTASTDDKITYILNWITECEMGR